MIYDKLDQFVILRPTKTEPVLGDDRKFHYVYVLIHLETERFYIGKHSETIDENYYGSGSHISNAILKYGKDAFHKFIVSYHTSDLEAYIAEGALITKEMVESKDCFNERLNDEKYFGFATGSNNYSTMIWDNKNPNYAEYEQVRTRTTENINILLKNKWSDIEYREKHGNRHRKIWTDRNPSAIKTPWFNTKSSILNRKTWWNADILFEIYRKSVKKLHYRSLTNYMFKHYGLELSPGTVLTCLDLFDQRWHPLKDFIWIEFKIQYKPDRDSYGSLDSLNEQLWIKSSKQAYKEYML